MFESGGSTSPKKDERQRQMRVQATRKGAHAATSLLKDLRLLSLYLAYIHPFTLYFWNCKRRRQQTIESHNTTKIECSCPFVNCSPGVWRLAFPARRLRQAQQLTPPGLEMAGTGSCAKDGRAMQHQGGERAIQPFKAVRF